MNGYGYRREYIHDRHVRIVEDRQAALDHLGTYWKELPAKFFKWLATADVGDVYLLTKGVGSPETWVMAA